MPHASFKIKAGVDQNETPALNEAGISTSNLIRFIYDRNGDGLVQKLGGWVKYYPNYFSKVIRAIWPWEDINANTHLAVGMQDNGQDYQSQLNVITNGASNIVTPQALSSNPTLSISTTNGSSIVQITDANVSGIYQYDSVYITTQISIGGLILFGMYQCMPVGGNTYAIQAKNILGNPINATSTTTTAYIPQIVTTTSNIVTVNFNAHGYNAGDTFSILIPTIVDGITFYGEYIIQGVSINSFTILISSTPTASSAYINNGNPNYIYNFGVGAAPSGTGYGVGGYGMGGYGSGTTITPTNQGKPVSAYNWTLDNWGSDLVAVPLSNEVTFIPASASGNGTTATINLYSSISVICDIYQASPYIVFPSNSSNIYVGQIASGTYIQSGSIVTSIDYYEGSGWGVTLNLPLVGLPAYVYETVTFSYPAQYAIPVGNSITLSGFSPSTWNGTFYVASSTGSFFTFSSSLTGSATVLGTVTVNYAPYQPIYIYDALGSTPIAVALANAPAYNDGVFVAMPQRQLVSWGTTFTGIPDPLLIRWSDVNNYNSWIGTVSNQAGSYRLPKGSKIVAAIQAPQQGLVFTDLGVWAMQYIGPPYVYGFNELGTGCGLIARKAVASIAGAIYWMGTSQFFTLSGEGVQPVPCPVWDVIFQDLDTSNLDKIRVAVNSLFGEIAWYYPTISNSGENNAYVKYNVFLKCWDFGTLSRSAWTDQSVLGKPIGADPATGYLYQHETSPNADGVAMNSFFRTGYFAMSEADIKSFVDEVWPDMKWGTYGGNQGATVYITFYVTDFAGATPEVYGPYQMTQATTWFNPRFRGRLVSIQLSSSDLDSFWRIGNIRYRFQPDGKY